MLLELVRRDGGKVLEQLSFRDLGLALLAAGREQVGEQRLEDCESLGRDRPGRTLDDSVAARGRLLAGRLRRLSLVPLAHAPQRRGDIALELRRLEWHRAAVLAQHPGSELGDGRVLGDEDVVLERPRRAVCAPYPPGRVAAHLDPRRADAVAD